MGEAILESFKTYLVVAAMILLLLFIVVFGILRRGF